MAGKTRADSTSAGKASTSSCNASTGVVASVVSGDASAGDASASDTSAGGAAQGTANRAWLALEAVIALLAAGEDTTLLLEVGHADSWESGGGVVLGSVVVNLMDGDGGVDDSWLDDLWRVVVSTRSQYESDSMNTYPSGQQAGWSRGRGGGCARRQRRERWSGSR